METSPDKVVHKSSIKPGKCLDAIRGDSCYLAFRAVVSISTFCIVSACLVYAIWCLNQTPYDMPDRYIQAAVSAVVIVLAVAARQCSLAVVDIADVLIHNRADAQAAKGEE